MPFRRPAARAASRNARRLAAGLAPESLERRTLFAAPNITGIDTGGDAFWNEGEYVFVGGSFTDSDANDRRTVVVDWGDGSPAHVETLNAGVRGFSTNRHAYPDDETSVLGQPRRYTITVTVTDSTFQSDTETRPITVRNLSPVLATLPTDFGALEGSPLTLPGVFHDHGADTHTFNWKVTRGYWPDPEVTVFESTARDLVFTPPEEGSYRVVWEVRDDDGGSNTATTQILATNAPPTLSISGAESAAEGAPYLPNLSATDPGTDTIASWTIDWGDGSVETISGNAPAVSHAYDGPGNYVIRATATDEDGTWAAAPLGVAYRAGDVDGSFGTGAGRAVTDFPLPVETNAEDALAYPDGRLLVLRSTGGPNAAEGLSLSRFNPDGSFDGTFDGDGRLFLPGRWNTNQTLALQPDGKILFAAIRTNGTMFESYLDVFRLNPDGTRDAAFGAAGVATAPVGVEHEGTIKTANDVLLLPDGRIVVATGSAGLFTARMQALRFNADGSRDTTFGTGGRIEIDPPPGLKVAAAWEALLAPDGRVVLVGSGTGPSGTNPSTTYYGLVAALAPDGSLDASFGSGGWVTRSFGSNSFNGLAGTFVPGGDLVVAYGTYSAASAWTVVRYNLGGQPNAFGPDGVADPAFSWGYVTSVIAAPGDKILVAGTTSATGASGMAVARYNADGTLDSTFGAGGKVLVAADVGGGAPAVRVAPGGRVVAVGRRDGKLLTARFTDAGLPDTTFGQGGQLLENRLGPWSFVSSTVRAVHVLPDKKVLAIGRDPNGRGDWLFMARHNPDGTPDLTFGDFGRLATRYDYFVGAFDASGRFLIHRAGALTRLNPDGSTDPSFQVPDPAILNYVGRYTVAPGGKIVGVGLREDRLVVVRLNADGTPDTTFADGGRFEGFPGFGSWDAVKAVTVLPDGRIVVGGRGLARLTAAGAPDPAFGGGDGFVPAPSAAPDSLPGFNHARGLALDSAGRVVSTWDQGGGTSYGGYAVARFLADGSLDPTFGGDGLGLYAHGHGGGLADTVALDPSGRILVGGFGADTDTFGALGYTALRLLPDGSRDLSFGRNGVVAVPTNSAVVGETLFDQVAVTDTGDVLLGGLDMPSGRFLLSRFHADDERAVAVDVTNAAPRVDGRHVFYDNSSFDGRFAGPGPADDAAVATDKHPLAPGGILVNPFASVTGYHRGLNGIMFDIAGGLPMTALAGIAGSVGLKTGTGGDPAAWADAPRPAQVGIRPGAGVGSSDRVTLTWLGDAVRNAWLQVTVHAPAEWGLPDDVFVFGNLVGETQGSVASWPRVDGTDVRVVRSAVATRAAVTHPGDHNRDGRVNAIDVYWVRAAQGNTLAPVTGPAPAAAPGPAGRLRATRRGVLDLSSAPVRP